MIKKASKPILKKLRLLTILALAVNLAFSVSLFFTNGWFNLGSGKTVDSDSAEIDEPPILYILDNDAEDITQLSLSGLEIGVEKQIVFCVSSVYPVDADAVGHKTAINLELAYTNNLGASFNLYNADIVSDPNTTGAVQYYSQRGQSGYFVKREMLTSENVVTSTSEGNVKSYSDNGYTLNDVQALNRATYKKYLSSNENNSSNNTLHFTSPVSNPGGYLFDTSKCRFFILDITWENLNGNTSALQKETDLVYIIAKGGGTA